MDQSDVLPSKIKQLSIENAWTIWGTKSFNEDKMKLTGVVKPCNTRGNQSRVPWDKIKKNLLKAVRAKSLDLALDLKTNLSRDIQRTFLANLARRFGGRHFEAQWPEVTRARRSRSTTVEKSNENVVIRARVTTRMRVSVKSVDHVVVTSGNALPDVIVGRGLREKTKVG